MGDQVDAAAHFEGADRLVVLMLDVYLRADQFVQRGVAVQRRARQVRPDAPLGGHDIAKGRNMHYVELLLVQNQATFSGKGRQYCALQSPTPNSQPPTPALKAH